MIFFLFENFNKILRIVSTWSPNGQTPIFKNVFNFYEKLQAFGELEIDVRENLIKISRIQAKMMFSFFAPNYENYK